MTPVTIAPALTPTAAVWQRIGPLLIARGVECFVDHAPFPIERSGTCYAVLTAAEPGAHDSGYHGTLTRGRVAVNIFSDHTRDSGGMIAAFDAESRALGVFEYANPWLDGMTQHEWPEVVSCRRVGPPRVIEVPEGDGALMLNAVYEVDLFGSKEIRTR